ncbi:MAG TPA: FAD-dependent oxidoreductase [Polyangiaceae bacterium]|jgi:nitrite reductase (NADH) large subunit
MGKKKLAIIGNGMATCRLLDELASRDGFRQYEVTVFGEEPGGTYNRVLLSRVLEGDEPDTIVTKPAEWFDQHGVRLISGTRVSRVDLLKRWVATDDGQTRRYDVAVLATGSQPLVPPLEGMNGPDGELRPGVFVYRTMSDCVRMRAHARAGDNAIVVGGGLLGLEAAKVLSDQGLHVTIVHLAPILMNTQLDTLAGSMLRRQIERCGIFVRLGRTVEAVYGDDVLGGVILDDGTTLPADMVVLACGVRPRVEVARASGIPVNKGIVVNDSLATEVPGVYALGECAEHRGRIYGLVAPVWEQATVLADALTGKKSQARYKGSKPYARLKVAGVDVASMGCLEPEGDGDQVFQVIEERRDAYRKLVVRNGRLVGAMLVGNTAAAAALIQIFDRGDPLPDDPLEVLCQIRAASSAADRLICSCNKVTGAILREAIDAGADSVDALGEATKAGTGCGSCKGELEQLLTLHAKKAPLLPMAG